MSWVAVSQPFCPGSLQRNLHWLHGFSTVSGALEVSPGLWMGGNVLEILQKANTAGQPCWKPLRVCALFALGKKWKMSEVREIERW